MNRDSFIGAGTALALHAAVLFGIQVQSGPSLFEKTSTEPPYVEVTLAAPPPPPAPEPVVTAPATPVPQPVAPEPEPVPPPPPEPKSEPEPPKPKPEPLPEPELPPTPKPAVMTKPAPASKPATPQPAPPQKPAPQPPAKVATAKPASPAPAVPTTTKPATPSTPGVPSGVPGGTGQVTKQPFPTRNPKPDYPRRAKELGQQGVALVTVYISEFGRVDKVELKQSSGHALLDEAALEAAKKWRFRPAQLNKRAVPSKVEIPFRFELK
jgi:periplasmic protein TonB